MGPGPKSRFNSAYCGPQGTGKGSCSLYSNPKENEQAPVIPLCNCCASTRRPIETGPIFRNSFMTFLTHMQFHGLKTKTPALLEFMLGSPFLIFPCLLFRSCFFLLLAAIHARTAVRSLLSTAWWMLSGGRRPLPLWAAVLLNWRKTRSSASATTLAPACAMGVGNEAGGRWVKFAFYFHWRRLGWVS